MKLGHRPTRCFVQQYWTPQLLSFLPSMLMLTEDQYVLVCTAGAAGAAAGAAAAEDNNNKPIVAYVSSTSSGGLFGNSS